MERWDLIERYLAELDAELRLPIRVRRRILAETREHLRDSVYGAGTDQENAQRRAVESFGTPAAVASEFARELAIGTTRRAVRHGGVLFVLALVLWDVCTSSFIHLAPGWINDGPGAAVLWVVGQIGLVAGAVSLARARVARQSATLDSGRLRYAVRGLIVLWACTTITVLMVATGVVIALTGNDTRQPPLLLVGLIAACGAVTVTSAAAVRHAHKRLTTLDREPLEATGVDALADLATMVADTCAWARRHLSLPAFHSLRIRVTPEPAIRNVLSVCDPRAHPWRYASAIALLAGIAVPLLDLVVLAVQARLNGPQLSDLAITAPALIAIEATLVIACYAILGPYLGLRPTRKRP